MQGRTRGPWAAGAVDGGPTPVAGASAGAVLLLGSLCALLSAVFPAAGQTPALLLAIAAATTVGGVALVLLRSVVTWTVLNAAVIAGELLLVAAAVDAAGDRSRLVAVTGLAVLGVLPSALLLRPRPAAVHLGVVVAVAVALRLLAPGGGTVVEAVYVAVALVAVAVLGVVLSRAVARADVDDLTQLPNRRALARALDAHVAAPPPAATSLAMLDLDGFKEVNDTHGHGAGDARLVAVARHLRARLPDGLLARIGGDEFVWVVEAGEDEARQRLEEATSGLPDGQRVSFGVAVLDASDSAATWRQRADADLYAAKRRRRGLLPASLDTPEAEELLRAITDGELVLRYQPVVDLGTGALTGVEALVRWQHPERGLLPPSTFLPLAEATGVVDLLGARVLRAACHEVREWQRRTGTTAGVAVNVSGAELASPAYPGRVLRALADSGLSASDLVLEVTETAFAEAPTMTASLAALRAAGVRVAVDDFGTGWSTLSRLDQLPVDVLKLDKSFVDRVVPGEGCTPVVDAVLAMARALDLEVTAEGVETAEQVCALRDAGCDAAQGYHLQRPVPLEDVELSARLRTAA
ncbi:bifunctional diguanylate cyclase/phosphodiesterase [Pseudokineococcus marinus]|uniref:Bifunctional diguanylate cyclase/phosphodiesterase n=1 Tax=Pseudokineococcus marinus TaxID=351215 RepID=A0A849BIB0_9ACTN|nr:bifunctional diguanylate cyclase/phosphodiesterase [Pseudokineococcus marinus]NNH22331.1 bifunctional diguanylate cyclase/phosphodiesterase [Pseudokineococcus marinus]